MSKYRLPDQRFEPPPEDPIEVESETVSLGFMRGPGRSIPLEAATRMENLRFEDGGVRKDFGWRPLGLPASRRILGLIEHKFIAGSAQYRRLLRVTRNDSQQPQIEVWDGVNWVFDLASAEAITDRLLSIISIQGKLVMAEGTKILIRDETTPSVAATLNFPAGNSLTAPGDETFVSKDGVQALGDLYRVNFEVDLTINNGSGYTLVVVAKLNGVEVGRRTYSLGSGNKTWSEEYIEFTAHLSASSNTISLEIEEVRATLGTTVTSDIAVYTSGAVPAYTLDKVENDQAQDREYTFDFEITATGIHEIKFYYDPVGFGSFVLLDTETFTAVGRYQRTFVIPDDMTSLSVFGLNIAGTGPSFIAVYSVYWNRVKAGVDYDVAVHGYNVPTDADPSAGVEYDVAGALTGVFELIDAAAPAARYLGSLGDRLLAIGDGLDTQVLSASADGDIRSWSGSDTYSAALLDTRGDPIDDLQAVLPIGPNLAALFRKRSIMRVYETGDPTLPIGVVHWLDGIGTEFPFSCQIVTGGIAFLGHDRMVYIFSANGQIQPVGGAIQQELAETLTANFEVVDSAYDPIFHDYMLGIPEGGASNITAVWILNIAEMLAGRAPRWRKRSINAVRLAVTGGI